MKTSLEPTRQLAKKQESRKFYFLEYLSGNKIDNSRAARLLACCTSQHSINDEQCCLFNGCYAFQLIGQEWTTLNKKKEN